MIVDDDMDSLLPLKRSLERENYKVVEAYNGHEALKKAAAEIPDIILLDLMMPDMDGWDVYHHIKADESTREIPVIIITAKAQNIDKVLGLHIAKVDDYISKPFSPQELIDSVEKVLKLKTSS